MSGLTAEEISFLEKMEKNKQKHREAQAKYRTTKKDVIKEYNKKYYDEQREKLNSILSKQPKVVISTPINIQQIAASPPKIDRRTRRGKKATEDIRPFYETRKEPLEYSTIDDYLSKADILQRFFTKKSTSPILKAELRKLYNDNKNIDEELILSEMSYINNDIEPTIKRLREHYKNDNTFKSYINILVGVSSHLKTLNKSVYQTLTKLNIFLNQQIQEKRKHNTIEEADREKIIDLDKTTILSNLYQLKNMKDKLIYGLYCLFPARREEWRFTKLTNETDEEKLKHPVNNYLILSNPKRIIFNNYKTYKTYGQQDFIIDDKDLNDIIDDYISSNKLKINDYIFGLDKDKRQVIAQPNFSRLISNVFFKIYNIPVSIRFIRMSWVSSLLNRNPSIIQMEKLANYMAHSKDEQGKYKKILN